MAQALAEKISREKLTQGLERASKSLKKKLGVMFEPEQIPAIVDELLLLQDEKDVELKTADIPTLRIELIGLEGADLEKDILLSLSLDVLEIVQAGGRGRKAAESDVKESDQPTASTSQSDKESETTAKTKTPGATAATTAQPEVEYSDEATYGFVVIQGDHHTIAVGTLDAFEIKFDREFSIANKHCKGGQSQNRFARLAEESRQSHLKAVYDRMERAFQGEEDTSPLVSSIFVAGPGPMKTDLMENLPRRWQPLVHQPFTTTQVGLPGVNQLIALIKESVSTSTNREKQRQRQRERKEDRKNVKGAQRGGGRFDRQNERKRREEEEKKKQEQEEKERKALELATLKNQGKKKGGKGKSKNQ